MPSPGLDDNAPAEMIAGSLRVLPDSIPGVVIVDTGETLPSTCTIGLKVMEVGDVMAYSVGCGVRGGPEKAVVVRYFNESWMFL